VAAKYGEPYRRKPGISPRLTLLTVDRSKALAELRELSKIKQRGCPLRWRSLPSRKRSRLTLSTTKRHSFTGKLASSGAQVIHAGNSKPAPRAGLFRSRGKKRRQADLLFISSMPRQGQGFDQGCHCHHPEQPPMQPANLQKLDPERYAQLPPSSSTRMRY